jgi:hypothetical protein
MKFAVAVVVVVASRVTVNTHHKHKVHQPFNRQCLPKGSENRIKSRQLNATDGAKVTVQDGKICCFFQSQMMAIITFLFQFVRTYVRWELERFSAQSSLIQPI